MTTLAKSKLNNNIFLHLQADDIVKRTSVLLHWTDIHLISAVAEVDNLFQLRWLADHIRQQYNRIVVLTSANTFTDLVIAKSDNVPYFYPNEIIYSLAQRYHAQINGNTYLAYTTLYKQDIASELIDQAVESIVLAIPYNDR